jgi:galactose mutarotase-like enzyme
MMNTTLSNSKLSAVINPLGAELISLRSLAKNKEYIWEGNPTFWGKHSPVLFPIVGTLKNNSFHYNDKDYELLRHGLARSLNFHLITKSETHCVFSLEASEETNKAFPFAFELQISYTLVNTTLTIGYKVINKDNVAIPFSIGAHPAFALPNAFENYSLQFSQQETLECFTLENDLIGNNTYNIELDNQKLPLTYSTFENDALIFKTLQSKEITILEKNEPLLKVAFPDFNNLGLWTKVNAPFICIEPWLGYSDTINTSGNLFEKEGIQVVAMNESFECEFSIEVF